jgi:hypothetical protein
MALTEAAPYATKSSIEFLRCELAPGKDGTLFLRIDATSVEETGDQFELIEQLLGNEKVASLQAALDLISEHARRYL